MYKFTQRSPITLILLSIVTCGIYFIYWLYVTAKEINDALGREEINTVLVILGFFCFPVMIYVMYKFGNAIEELAGRIGMQSQSSFILWLILSLVFGVGMYIMEYQVQTDLNNFSSPNNYNGNGYYYNNYGQPQGGGQPFNNQQNYYQPPQNGQNYNYNQQQSQAQNYQNPNGQYKSGNQNNSAQNPGNGNTDNGQNNS
mgnify:CR=1 FL=1